MELAFTPLQFLAGLIFMTYPTQIEADAECERLNMERIPTGIISP